MPCFHLVHFFLKRHKNNVYFLKLETYPKTKISWLFVVPKLTRRIGDSVLVGLNRNGDFGGSPPSFRIGDRFRSALLDFLCGVCVGANFNDFAAFGLTFKILFR